MKLRLTRPVRVGVYVVTLLGTPVVAYLRAKGILGDYEVQLWAAEVTAAGTLAAVKVLAPDEPATERDR